MESISSNESNEFASKKKFIRTVDMMFSTNDIEENPINQKKLENSEKLSYQYSLRIRKCISMIINDI